MTETPSTASEQVAVQYRTMQNIVTDYLRSAIVSRRFGPGERLSQDDLARELRVSRMPVREALRILASEGLVELRPHRSAVVVSLNPDDIVEIFGIRAMLEAGAAELAAPRMGDATVARLRQIYEEMSRAIDRHDGDGWQALNAEFHSTILRDCGWPRLRTLIDAQHNALLPYQRAAASLLARMVTAHQEHHGMLVAAEGRDGPALARATADHIRATAQELISYLSDQGAAGVSGDVEVVRHWGHSAVGGETATGEGAATRR